MLKFLHIFSFHPAVFGCWFMLYSVIFLVLLAVIAEKKGKRKYVIAKIVFGGCAAFSIFVATYCVYIQDSVWPFY